MTAQSNCMAKWNRWGCLKWANLWHGAGILLSMTHMQSIKGAEGGGDLMSTRFLIASPKPLSK